MSKHCIHIVSVTKGKLADCPNECMEPTIEGTNYCKSHQKPHTITMRLPPWPCPSCGKDTITVFEWIVQDNGNVRDEGYPTGSFKATCTACGEVIYS